MSEPIQSISQGNYILATQQEVSHDNTLSGNGTVESPLGVVPCDWINISGACSGLSDGIEVKYNPLIKTVQIIGNLDAFSIQNTNWYYVGRITANAYQPLQQNAAMASYSNKDNCIVRAFIDYAGGIGFRCSVTGSQNIRFTTRFDVSGNQS